MLTKAEIEHELRFAKNHEKQLGIIAELNDMSVDDVRRRLSGIETAPPCDPPKEEPETAGPPERGRKKGSNIDAPAFFPDQDVSHPYRNPKVQQGDIYSFP